MRGGNYYATGITGSNWEDRGGGGSSDPVWKAPPNAYLYPLFGLGLRDHGSRLESEAQWVVKGAPHDKVLL